MLKILEVIGDNFYVNGIQTDLDSFSEEQVSCQRACLVERTVNFDTHDWKLIFDMDRTSPYIHFNDPFDYP